MKRNILLIIFILVLIYLIWKQFSTDQYGYNEPEEHDNVYLTEDDSWLKFIDESGDFSVHYPADWELEDHSYKEEMIRADISREAHTGVQIRMISTSNLDLQDFAPPYIDQFMEEMKAHWKGNIYENQRDFLYIGSNYGCKSTILFDREDGEKWLFIEYIWLRSNYVLIFQAGTRQEFQADKEPVLDQIAASLKFLN